MTTEHDEIHVVTAFLTYQLPDGSWRSTSDMGVRLVIDRPAVPDDIVAGSAVAVKDVTCAEAGVNVLAQIERRAAAQIQAAQQQRNGQSQTTPSGLVVS